MHKVRKNVREFQLLEPFADTAKRILSLLDFRIGIVDRDLFGYERKCEKDTSQECEKDASQECEKDTSQECEKDTPRLKPQKYMYLVATFDGPWEPYMRLIWKPLGTFLDLVLCNCDGYKPANHTSFEEYSQWVRDHMLDTAIFYSVSGLTVRDKIYLEKLERIQRENLPDQADDWIAQMTIDTPNEAAN